MNIYVGNLSFSTTEEELKEMFAPFGQVDSVSIIKDKFSGRSRGFGFVEMPDSSQGQAAIADLNGKETDGRALKVNEAHGQGERRSGGGGGGGGGRGRGGGGGGRGRSW